ncbi:hypothetical protein F3087_34170 [Nocardia colli]|uniref:Uncharacterized protein n=1 Tax=Nocardia colli TaxID=2545717 RepID=A0A5N0E4B2_9NOCA|nr:hypothetical protein [Nocardia colli]KAA8884272.1 hypothetical protein F3087_34170 [Nocardia colli]
MTKNKARKRENRRRAAALGISYTRAHFTRPDFAAAGRRMAQVPPDFRVPRGVKQALVRLRIQYTGEPLSAANAGTGRDGSLGLDMCSSRQRTLRAILALGLFNRGYHDVAPAADWGLHTVLAYSVTMSPQHNRLVIITDTPHNVAQYFFDAGLGFRLEEYPDNGVYVCQHLPTGAQLVIAIDASWKRRVSRGRPMGYQGIDVPLSEHERQRLESIPDMSSDAEKLLAGLTCRADSRDPDSKWALGNWFYDPLETPSSARDRLGSYDRTLWGASNRWTIRLKDLPHIDDIAQSLTANRVGIPGATWRDLGDHIVVSLGRATLAIYGPRRTPVPSSSAAQPIASDQGGA